MKVKCNKGLLIMVLVLLAQYFLSIEFLFLALLFVILGEIVLNRGQLKLNKIPCRREYLFFMVFGLIVGGINGIFNGYTLKHYFKDILYMTLMIAFWIIGSNMYIRGEDSQKKDVLLAGTLLAIIDLSNCMVKIIMSGSINESLYELRALIGTGGPIAMVTLFWCIYFNKSIFIKRIYKVLCVIILTADICVHFSRMNILIAIVFIVCSGAIKKPIKLIKYLVVVSLIVLVMSFISPEMLLMYGNKLFDSLKEVSFVSKVWDKTAIVQNWRGYEVYCEIENFIKNDFSTKMIGGGFGVQLNVGRYAYLISTEDTIPFLHNGYFTILMIWGILGVIIYFVMLKSLFKRVKGYERTSERRFWNALVMLVAIDTFFVHGPFFSASVACIFMYLAILENDKRNILNSREFCR